MQATGTSAICTKPCIMSSVRVGLCVCPIHIYAAQHFLCMEKFVSWVSSDANSIGIRVSAAASDIYLLDFNITFDVARATPLPTYLHMRSQYKSHYRRHCTSSRIYAMVAIPCYVYTLAGLPRTSLQRQYYDNSTELHSRVDNSWTLYASRVLWLRNLQVRIASVIPRI